MAEASLQFTHGSNRLADAGQSPPWLAPDDTMNAGNWAELSAATSSKTRYEQFERAVQRDIVSRLAPALRDAETVRAAGPWAGSIETIAGLILAQEVPSAMAYLERMRARGMAAETLYLELLAPTARHFGDLWNEDVVDFGQVTIGLGHLQRLLRDLGPPAEAPVARARQPGFTGERRRGLLVAAPGEQHSFGLAMVSAFFRRAGWVIWSGAPTTAAELNRIVRGHWFDVVGFSLAYEGRLEALRAGVRAVREASRNPCIRIMVGGPVFIENPEFVVQVGADAMALDGRQAVLRAESLLTRLPA
jgi:methanogenic corrinoid protein MtbC1